MLQFESTIFHDLKSILHDASHQLVSQFPKYHYTPFRILPVQSFISIIRVTTQATDFDMTSTEVAGSMIDSMLHVIPSDTDLDQATATTWTEGIGPDRTYADELNLGEIWYI